MFPKCIFGGLLILRKLAEKEKKRFKKRQQNPQERLSELLTLRLCPSLQSDPARCPGEAGQHPPGPEHVPVSQHQPGADSEGSPEAQARGFEPVGGPGAGRGLALQAEGHGRGGNAAAMVAEAAFHLEGGQISFFPSSLLFWCNGRERSPGGGGGSRDFRQSPGPPAQGLDPRSPLHDVNQVRKVPGLAPGR